VGSPLFPFDWRLSFHIGDGLFVCFSVLRTTPQVLQPISVGHLGGLELTIAVVNFGHVLQRVFFDEQHADLTTVADGFSLVLFCRDRDPDDVGRNLHVSSL
jgi:hypothetical protein